MVAALCGRASSFPAAAAAIQATQADVPPLSESAEVSVLTVLPGDRLYNLFGHTIIRFRDPETGLDVGFNYGTFDFPESVFGGAGFVARFAYGKLDYRLQVSGNPSQAIDWYARQEGRSTIEQTLDLTSDQADSLFSLLVENARPENAVYRYDFFFDNCSTRPRDALERVLGDRLHPRTDDPGTSFRRMLDPYLTANPGVNLSMDIGLGSPADRHATAREALFLPVELMKWLDAAEVENDGLRRPLVSRSDTLTRASEAGRRDPAIPWPTLVSWTIAAGIVLLSIFDRRAGRRVRRWLDGGIFSLAGIAGIVLGFLVFVSLHSVTKPNLNLVWALPTHLVAGGVLLTGRNPRWMRLYMRVVLVLASIFLLGLPFWTQEIPAAVIPIVLAIASRAATLAFPDASPEDSNSRHRAEPRSS
jgi:hypothetical protein